MEDYHIGIRSLYSNPEKGIVIHTAYDGRRNLPGDSVSYLRDNPIPYELGKRASRAFKNRNCASSLELIAIVVYWSQNYLDTPEGVDLFFGTTLVDGEVYEPYSWSDPVVLIERYPFLREIQGALVVNQPVEISARHKGGAGSYQVRPLGAKQKDVIFKELARRRRRAQGEELPWDSRHRKFGAAS